MIPAALSSLKLNYTQPSLNAKSAIKFGNDDKPADAPKPPANPASPFSSWFPRGDDWLGTLVTGAADLLRQGGELLAAAGDKLANQPAAASASTISGEPPVTNAQPETKAAAPALAKPEAPKPAAQTFECSDIQSLPAAKQPKAQKWIDSLNRFLAETPNDKEAYAVRLSEAVECLNGIVNEENNGYEYGKKFTLTVPNNGLLENNTFEIGAAESFMLTNVRLQLPDGSPVAFKNSALADCGFITNDFNGVDFSNTTIGREHNEVTFFGCEMQKAKFVGAQSGHSVDFRACKLQEADFTNAVLKEGTVFSESCNLSNAHFEGADLREVVLREDTILTGATYNAQTQFPEGFDPDEHGMRIV